MKNKGKKIATIIMLLLVVLLIMIALTGHLTVVTGYIIFLLLLATILLIGYQYDKIVYLIKENKKNGDILTSNEQQLKQTVEELKESKKLLEQKDTEIGQFYNNVDVSAFSFDVANKQLDVAKGIEQIYGYTYFEFIENYLLWYDVIHPDDKYEADKIKKDMCAGNKGIFEHRIVRKDGDICWVALRYNSVTDTNGKPIKILGVVIDITDRKLLEEKLKQLAYHDELTDLPNRTLLKRHLKKAIARALRHDDDLTLMFIDLDGFKKVNDTLGHDAGDLLLKEVAKRLNHIVREEDLISRIGGDEFIIVFEDTGKDEVEGIAKRVVNDLSEPYTINEEEAKISPSIGISIFPKDGTDAETLIQNADKAMYAVKKNGKSGYRFYSPELVDLRPEKTVFEKFVNLFTK